MDNYQAMLDRVLAALDRGDSTTPLDFLRNGDASADSDATCLLAVMYINGVGVIPDTERGMELYVKSMNMGNAHAAEALALIYDEGKYGISPNEELSNHYLSAAVQGELPFSMGLYALNLFDGIGTSPNEILAFEFASKAAKLGDANGMIVLARCYFDGVGGVQKDPYAAAHWYREALSTGDNTQWKVDLAECLADPQGRFGISPTQEMYDEAFSLLSQAVEAGDAQAHALIGIMYTDGLGVVRDQNLAYQYVKLAADNGNEWAQGVVSMYRRNIFGKWEFRG